MLAFTVPHMDGYLRHLAERPWRWKRSSVMPVGGLGRDDAVVHPCTDHRLAVITAIGAVGRLGYLFAVKIDDALLLNDSLYYSIQAGRNSEGDWFARADRAARRRARPADVALPHALEPRRGDNVEWQRFATTAARHRHGRRDRARRPAPGRAASASSPRRSRPSTRTCGSTTRS